MDNQSLLEALADIAFTAGHCKYYNGDSREAISEFIRWAKEFEELHKNTDWDSGDYIETVEAFAVVKMREQGHTLLGWPANAECAATEPAGKS
ncbi:hypothetical protein [Hymenobacter sp. YC55]|uniref:hypothetical protein n=1 Tax=Hymenobacter sp. YC55 TaxID=3034019 RepID=UPI0023F805DC|nr:hypothetical protein [Hymenobacter sp. YC55]MDF7815279.1 hypothetical protein [Hymenobacter sp. YC55]